MEKIFDDIHLIDALKTPAEENVKSSKIRKWLQQNSQVKLKSALKVVSGLSCKMLLINEYYLWTNSTGKRLGASLQQFRIQNKIDTLIKFNIAGLNAKERNGDTFESMLFRIFGVLSAENEEIVINQHKDMMMNSKLNFFSSHRKFLELLFRVIDIINQMKVMQIDLEQFKNILDKDIFKSREIKYIFRNLIDYDPFFKAYTEFLLNYLDSEISEVQTYSNKNIDKNRDKLLFKELANQDDVSGFSDISELLLDSNDNYIDVISIQFDLLLQRPLSNIYKLLRFPTTRDGFVQWIKSVPIPVRESQAFLSFVEQFKASIRRNAENYIIPRDDNEVLALFYDFSIDATEKYKLIYNSTVSEKLSAGLKKTCLHIIKNIQFNLEEDVIQGIIKKLNTAENFDHVNDILTTSKFNIAKRIRKVKNRIQPISDILHKKLQDKADFINSFGDLIKDEKLISVDILKELARLLRNKGDSSTVLNIANFLIRFYILLNCRLIIKNWTDYIDSISENDGIFLKKLISIESKDGIYEQIKKFKDDKPKIVTLLSGLIKRAHHERLLRQDIIKKLSFKHEELSLVKVGKISFSARIKRPHIYLLIHNELGELRYRKKGTYINNFLDFKNVAKRHNINALVKITDRQLKLVYQQAYLFLVDELDIYIKNRFALLDMEDKLTDMSQNNLGEEFEKSNRSRDFLQFYIDQGEKEEELRNTVILELEEEQQNSINNPKSLNRIQSEMRAQRIMLSRLDKMSNYIEKLMKESVSEEIQRVKEWASRKAADVPEQQEDIAEASVEMLLHQFSKVKKENIEVSFLNNTASDNLNLCSTIHDSIKENRSRSSEDLIHGHCSYLESYLSDLPEIETLIMENSIVDKEEHDPNEVFHNYMNLLTEGSSDVLNGILELTNKSKKELLVRKEYLHHIEKEVGLGFSILLYSKEVELQREAVEILNKLISFLSYELSVREKGYT